MPHQPPRELGNSSQELRTNNDSANILRDLARSRETGQRDISPDTRPKARDILNKMAKTALSEKKAEIASYDHLPPTEDPEVREERTSIREMLAEDIELITPLSEKHNPVGVEDKTDLKEYKDLRTRDTFRAKEELKTQQEKLGVQRTYVESLREELQALKKIHGDTHSQEDNTHVQNREEMLAIQKQVLDEQKQVLTEQEQVLKNQESAVKQQEGKIQYLRNEQITLGRMYLTLREKSPLSSLDKQDIAEKTFDLYGGDQVKNVNNTKNQIQDTIHNKISNKIIPSLIARIESNQEKGYMSEQTASHLKEDIEKCIYIDDFTDYLTRREEKLKADLPTSLGEHNEDTQKELQEISGFQKEVTYYQALHTNVEQQNNFAQDIKALGIGLQQDRMELSERLAGAASMGSQAVYVYAEINNLLEKNFLPALETKSALEQRFPKQDQPEDEYRSRQESFVKHYENATTGVLMDIQKGMQAVNEERSRSYTRIASLQRERTTLQKTYPERKTREHILRSRAELNNEEARLQRVTTQIELLEQEQNYWQREIALQGLHKYAVQSFLNSKPMKSFMRDHPAIEQYEEFFQDWHKAAMTLQARIEPLREPLQTMKQWHNETQQQLEVDQNKLKAEQESLQKFYASVPENAR